MMRVANHSRLRLAMIVCGLMGASACIAVGAAPGAPASVKIVGPQFVVDGKPLQIISGEMHYPRVPREYWRDRMKKARAMGLNTIATYVFWNLHEPQPGVFDFSGQNDLAAFVRTAQEEGLYVLLRPGPYVCSEWDLGGLPAWLLADPNIVLRSTDPKFIGPAGKFLKRLGQELAPLQATRGGPIIGVQVENEYGSFGKDAEYMGKIRDAIVAAGLSEVPLFTADGPERLPFGTLPNVAAAINFGPGDAKKGFETLAKFRPDGLRMNQEYWDGWFDAWGKPHQTTNGKREADELEWMLAQGYSVNLYMFHGGTTFGFMNGANFERSYAPQTTSYDYNSPLDESGVPSAKFALFHDVIARRRAGEQFPDLPPAIPRIEIPDITLEEMSPLWANLGTAVETQTPRPMETFGQAYGYILYRTSVEGPASGPLNIHELRDYAQIYLDGKLLGSSDRRSGAQPVNVEIKSGAHTLDILVENSGRVNFGPRLRDDRKGITESVSVGDRVLTGWQVFCLPMNDFLRVQFKHQLTDGPVLYRGAFDLKNVGDTFLDMRLFGKGAVWVNGHGLGRYWNIGPQQTLYLPGAWLKPGKNEVIVFDLIPGASAPKLHGLARPILDLIPAVAEP
jgi:beta-galactosidase